MEIKKFLLFKRTDLARKVTLLFTFSFLPSAKKVCEGHVFTGVCLSMGGCLPHYMLGYTPPGQTPLPLGRHTPPGRHPLWQALPLGRHPLGRHPPAQCMLGYTHPCPVHAGIHIPLPSACWDTHNPLPSACCYTPSCTVHAGIRSISGRYAFHWNAFL